MHKSTRFTLTSTALLGILLYAVLRFADDLQTEPVEEPEWIAGGEPLPVAEPEVPQPAPAPPPPVDPRIPRIASYEELIAHLDNLGLNGRLLVDQAADWYRFRGFLGGNELLGVSVDESPDAYYATLDEATLLSMSASGDSGATLTLARMTMFRDPFAALDLYRIAVAQGSVYAGIKIADTLSFFADTRRAIGDAEFTRRFRELSNTIPREGPGNKINIEAYATLLAAMGDGGPPVVDDELLDWAAILQSRVPRESREPACRRAGVILAENGITRRETGTAPLSMEPPPVFFSPIDREARMPCADTGYPVIDMMDMGGCVAETIVGADGRESLLYVCPR